MAILIKQGYQQNGDAQGMRGKVKPQDLSSGTLFGQYQLRGSILVIKDNQDATSGYIAFGTDMTTIPTSPTTGTGILIDYRGIYGNNSGTPQFYLQSSDGKAYAGGGTVVLDVNGISMDGSADGSYLRWVNGANARAVLSSDDGHGSQNFNIYNNINNGVANGLLQFVNSGGPSLNRSNAFYLYAGDSHSYAFVGGTSFSGLYVTNAGIAGSFPTNPPALLNLRSTAPTFLMTDTTSSAKSLLLTVDANTATFEEAGGTDIMLLDLANARVGVGSAATSKLHVTTATASDGIRIDYTGSSGSGNSPQLSMHTNDGAAMASSDRIGQLAFGGHNGTSVVDSAFIIAQATETWSGTAKGSKMTFFTVPNTTTSVTPAMTIEQNQQVTCAAAVSVGTTATIAGQTFIGDTADSNVTIGLTINQGAADNGILALKSSDVAHGMTDFVETDTYGLFTKAGAADGGVILAGYTEATIGVRLAARHTTDDTNKATTAVAPILLTAQLKSGTSVTDVGANGNLLAVRNNATTRFFLDGDGDSHQDVGTAWSNFSVHNDVDLLKSLSVDLSKPHDPILKRFGQFLGKNRQELEALGIVQFNDDGDGHAFINWSRTKMLMIGAIIQSNERIERIEQMIANGLT